jgi:hypothetical protein
VVRIVSPEVHPSPVDQRFVQNGADERRIENPGRRSSVGGFLGAASLKKETHGGEQSDSGQHQQDNGGGNTGEIRSAEAVRDVFEKILGHLKLPFLDFVRLRCGVSPTPIAAAVPKPVRAAGRLFPPQR